MLPEALDDLVHDLPNQSYNPNEDHSHDENDQHSEIELWFGEGGGEIGLPVRIQFEHDNSFNRY